MSPAQVTRVHEAASAIPEAARDGFVLRVQTRLNVNVPRWRRSLGPVPEQVLDAAKAGALCEVAP